METQSTPTSAREIDPEFLGELNAKWSHLKKEIHRVVIGQDEIVDQLLTVLFARGHALIIGVPGLAKTLLVKTLAQALGWDFKRIQFTPDLMPSDITGTEILQTDPQTGERVLHFVKGPLFAHLILADEINRTSPKTQAALLEAMQEYTITAAGTSYKLDLPFFVVATQNPIEHEGTYPLPEAQLDRFMFSIDIGYPSKEEEMQIADETTTNDYPEINPIFAKEEVIRFQNLVRKVPVSRHVLDYAVSLARASRPDEDGAAPFIKEYVEWGAGPRAAQYLILAGKTRAALHGKTSPSCADIEASAEAVLQHRVIPNYNATGEGVTAKAIVEWLTEHVKQPSY
ncbi:MAG: MoxR family ATPase [Candidatus Omnitrophica bacterium]|nr:MoxR family ATPase [Candidatus Omnitrophota bacterium]